jgi:hypothetical protein
MNFGSDGGSVRVRHVEDNQNPIKLNTCTRKPVAPIMSDVLVFYKTPMICPDVGS